MMSARVAEAFSVAARADPTRGGDAESKGSPSFVRAHVDANAMGRMREKMRAVCGVLVKGLGASRRRAGVARAVVGARGFDDAALGETSETRRGLLLDGLDDGGCGDRVRRWEGRLDDGR